MPLPLVGAIAICAPRKALLQPLCVLHRDSAQLHIMNQVIQVNTWECTFYVHAQNGDHLSIPPSVLDHLDYFVQGVCCGPPRSCPILILRQDAR
jgi:hypothetical protein